jgi:hypothetical protein
MAEICQPFRLFGRYIFDFKRDKILHVEIALIVGDKEEKCPVRERNTSPDSAPDVVPLADKLGWFRPVAA